MIVRSVIFVALLLVASSAAAQDLDFSKITCKEFIAASKDEVGTILTWLEAYLYERKRAANLVCRQNTEGRSEPQHLL
jgi:hypothetical protein